jgi:glycosyltransferase involved in cell wall biosynthesis
MTSVSFVIPHMGREHLLIDTLQAIQDLDSSKFDVSVVVASKNETFSENLKKFSKSIDVTFLSLALSNTISEQRNIGANYTDSEFIAFIDADVALASDWLIQMHNLLVSDPKMAIASAKQINSNNPSVMEKLRTALSNIDLDAEMSSLPGSNLFLSRETFNKTGGFPAHLVTCEDHIFTQRALEFGTLYRSSCSAHVHLGEDKSFWGMAKKEVWRGQSNLVSLKGRKIPSRELPSLIAPPAFTFGILLCVIFAIFSQFTLSLIFGMGALFVLAVYTQRFKISIQEKISTFNILLFYTLYFPARTLGTVKGIYFSLISGSKNDKP